VRGGRSSRVKLAGDFGNAIERIRIGDRLPFLVFAKNSWRCNFQLLQHYRPQAEIAPAAHNDVSRAKRPPIEAAQSKSIADHQTRFTSCLAKPLQGSAPPPMTASEYSSWRALLRGPSGQRQPFLIQHRPGQSSIREVDWVPRFVPEECRPRNNRSEETPRLQTQ
jgi:hypothetical protein